MLDVVIIGVSDACPGNPIYFKMINRKLDNTVQYTVSAARPTNKTQGVSSPSELLTRRYIDVFFFPWQALSRSTDRFSFVLFVDSITCVFRAGVLLISTLC